MGWGGGVRVRATCCFVLLPYRLHINHVINHMIKMLK